MSPRLAVAGARSLLLQLACGWLLAQSPPIAATPLEFSYELDNRYQTSAGVYDGDGHLLRTLWSNRTRQPGAQQELWDGLDEDGRVVPDGAAVELRVIAHNINYRWEGVIGNTARVQLSATRHDYPYFMIDFEIAGGRAYTVSSTEGIIPRLRYLSLADANGDWAPRPGLVNLRGGFNYLSHVASDGERVYVARLARNSRSTAPESYAAFIFALDADLTREESFSPQGKSVCTSSQGVYQSIQNCYNDGRSSSRYASAIDIVKQHTGDMAWKNDVTGLAVQIGGSLLFAAHGHLDSLHVLDKRSGALRAEVVIPGVGELAVCRKSDRASAGALWAIHRDGNDAAAAVSRYGVDPDSGQVKASPELTLAGLAAPLNLALSADCTELVVADGGTAQQLKAFRVESGELAWTLGESGGYPVHGPQVTTDKLSFHPAVDADPPARERAFVNFADDGSLWVSDTGLSRVLHFDSRRKFIEQLAWIPINYNARVDLNNPTRVFRGLVEYALDYTKPIPEAWRLVQHYGLAMPDSLDPARHASPSEGFSSIATLANGRTYGLLPDTKGRTQNVMEVIAGRPLRYTGLDVPPFQFLRPDGSLESVRSGRVGEYSVEFCRRPLSGFDPAGNPVWGRTEIEASVRRGERDPHVNQNANSVRAVGRFADGLHVLFDPWKSEQSYFRLAAVRPGESHWAWRTSLGAGRFNMAEPDGRFDMSPVWYAGDSISVAGDHLVYNFHGEAWTDGVLAQGQANQFLHFHRSGLFLGQFGTPNLPDVPPAVAGLAGNSYSHQLFPTPQGLRFLHNDEHAHAGQHVWLLDGAEQVREFTARGRVGSGGMVLMPTTRPDPGVPAPPGLKARVVATPAGASGSSCGMALDWRAVGPGVTGYEVEKLAPTWVGLRFGSVGTTGAATTRYLDPGVAPGQQQVYRVRAAYGDRHSPWSLPATPRVPVTTNLLLQEDFDASRWRVPGRLPEGTCWGGGPRPAECGLVKGEGSESNRAFGIRHVTDGKPFHAWNGIRLEALQQEFNRALGAPVASTPRQYQLEFDYRVGRLPASGQVSLVVELVSSFIHPFAHSGGRIPIHAPEHPVTVGKWQRASGVVTALPNGRTGEGLASYWLNSGPPPDLSVHVEAEDVAAGESIEIQIDRVRVSRLGCAAEAEPGVDP